jgi:hypothetical protein
MPVRRPSQTDPTFWSYPLTPTKIEPVANGTWVNFLDLHGLPGFVFRVSSYVATVFGDATLANVDFRFILNGGLAPNMSLASGVDHNKVSPTDFPVIPQETFFYVGEQDRLILQARNNNLFQQLVIAGFFGWQYTNADSPQRDNISVIDDDT